MKLSRLLWTVMAIIHTFALHATGNTSKDYLRMPDVYSSGMVLQREQPLKISGQSGCRDSVTVEIGNVSGSTIADNTGYWELELPAMPAAEGLQMTVNNGADTLRFDDVAIGEVWIASGQSNMEFQLHRCVTFDEDSKSLNDSLLRLYNMKPIVYPYVRDWTDEVRESIDNLKYYEPTSWEKSTNVTAPSFSAIAWYFGKMLRDSLNVPVGIISNSIGGSPIEAWINIDTLKKCMPEVVDNWRRNEYRQPFVRQRINENMGVDDDSATHHHPYEPSYLFSVGIEPLNSFPARGIIWYQGEANTHNIPMYDLLFGKLVENWREFWNSDKMPFLFVQISSISDSSWPAFRNAQRLLAKRIPNVGMAVSSDHGDSLDVHPANKKPIGERLGLQALKKVYGRNSVMADGPMIKEAKLVAPHNVELFFDNADGLSTNDGGAPITFEVADEEGVFEYVDSASISSEGSVFLYSDKINKPRYVRYGWQPFTRANLINSAGLPCSTFEVEVKEDCE